MPAFEVTVDGRVYDIEAPSSDFIPQIVREIRASQPASQQQSSKKLTELFGESKTVSPEIQPASTEGPSPVEAALAAEGGAPELSLSARKTPSAEQPPAVPEAAPETTPAGVASAALRGAAPVATGAAVGAALGAPFAGVGAIPGAVAGATAMAFGDPIVSLVNRVFGTEITKPTDAMQHLLTSLGIPEAKTEAERLIQSATQAGAESFGVGGVGKAMAASAIPRVAKFGAALAAQPVQQAVSSAVGSVASDIARESGAPVWGQALAGILAGGAASKAAQIVPIGLGKEAVAPGIREAEKLGLSPMTSQAFPAKGPFGRFRQNVREAIPEVIPGSSAARLAEQEAKRKTLVEGIVSEYGANVPEDVIPKLAQDVITRRKNELEKWTGVKNSIFSNIDKRGIPVPALSTQSQIATEIQNLKRVAPKASKDLILELDSLSNDLKKGLSLSELEYRRKIFSSKLQAANLADLGEISSPIKLRVYSAINKDIEDQIFNVLTNEGVDPSKYISAWKKSNAKLSSMVKELSTRKLRTLLNSGDIAPETVSTLLFSQRPSEIRILMANLTPEGKALAKTAIFQKLASESFVDGAISPNKFASRAQKLQKSLSGVLTKQELDSFDGIVKALNATKRAGEMAQNPPTGVRTFITSLVSSLAGIAGFGGGGGSAATALGTAAGGVTLGMIYESKPVMNLFAMLSRVKTGSREEQAIAKRIIQSLQDQTRIKKEEKQ